MNASDYATKVAELMMRYERDEIDHIETGDGVWALFEQAIAAERERCAKIADELALTPPDGHDRRFKVAKEIAAKIRSENR
jgi:hypothetical protein